MAIGIALVLIFVLYLIDKHNRWRQALKLTVGLVVFSIFGVGVFFAWQKYQAYREEKQEQAESAARQARFTACISRLEQIPVPKDAAVADVPGDIQSACDANPYATNYMYISTSQPLTLPLGARLVPPKPKPKLKTESQPQSPPNCEIVVCSDSAIVRSEYGSEIKKRECFEASFSIYCGTIAALKKGDRVQFLSDKVRAANGSEIYEVKFQQWRGWTKAADLIPEKGDNSH